MKYVIGIDPGPNPGVVAIREGTWPLSANLCYIVQCSAESLLMVLKGLHENRPQPIRPHLAIEDFVDGARAGRGNAPWAGRVTRKQVQLVTDWADDMGMNVHVRSAATVKPWASDLRLSAAGLLQATRGMSHARDAARHALYCAVKDAGFVDPLSQRFRPSNRLGDDLL